MEELNLEGTFGPPLEGGPVLYCTICGGPIRDSPLSPKTKWLSEAILLRPSGESEDCPSPSVSEVDPRGNVHFRIKHTQEVVNPLDLRRDPLHPTSGLYILCHQSCFLLAQEALAHYELDPVQQIWKTLVLRAPKLPPFFLEPPVNWLGIWKSQEWEWQIWDSDEETNVNSIPFSQPIY